MSGHESKLSPLVVPIQGAEGQNGESFPALQISRRRTLNPDVLGGIHVWFGVLPPNDSRIAAHLDDPSPALAAAKDSIRYTRGSDLSVVEFSLPNHPTTVTAVSALRSWMNTQDLSDGRPMRPLGRLADNEARMNDPDYWSKQLARDPIVKPWQMEDQPASDLNTRIVALNGNVDVLSMRGDTYSVPLSDLTYAAAQLLVAHTTQQVS